MTAVRYYFDLVCPYSYILTPEVEQAEDEGLIKIEWLPFELRPAPEALPEPRGTYIRDHWRDHVYGLAISHGVEIHVPCTQPRSTLALALHSWAEEEGRGRAMRDAAHRAFFIKGLNLGDEEVLRQVTQEAGLDADLAIAAAWDPARISGLRAVREEACGIGVHGVPTIATSEEVLYYGAASPGKIRAMLASQTEIAG
ncbi:MAG TPA: DsbA family protein [Rubrobacteraceae bacterium]|nr:DsbA family protein [Rubrobacteraceae bacterium]